MPLQDDRFFHNIRHLTLVAELGGQSLRGCRSSRHPPSTGRDRHVCRDRSPKLLGTDPGDQNFASRQAIDGRTPAEADILAREHHDPGVSTRTRQTRCPSGSTLERLYKNVSRGLMLLATSCCPFWCLVLVGIRGRPRPTRLATTGFSFWGLIGLSGPPLRDGNSTPGSPTSTTLPRTDECIELYDVPNPLSRIPAASAVPCGPHR